MGTYWDDFLMEYPWISGAKLPTILQAFWEYCKRHEDFDKTIQRAREECNKPAVSKRVDVERRDLLIDFMNYELEHNIEGSEPNWIGKTVDNFLKSINNC